MKTLKFICMPVSGNGGIETVLVKVLSYLSPKNEYRIVLYLTSIPNNNLWLERLSKKVKIVRINSNNKISKLIYLTNIFLHAKNDDHFIILGANIIPFATRIRFLTGKKYWVTSWIHYSLTNQTIFNPHKLLKADDHWAISSAVKNALIHMGVASSNIHLIFNPIEKFNGELNKVDEKDSELKLVYVGRITLDGQKNLIELFNGVANYKKNSKIRVDLFGTQPDPNEISSTITKLNIEENIRIHGWVSDPWSIIVNDIHPKALIMTSAFEGLPMVSLEAMSRGIPCIMSNFNGVDDVVKDGVNGFVYQKGNIQDMLNKLKCLSVRTIEPLSVTHSIDKFYYDNYFKRLDRVLMQYD